MNVAFRVDASTEIGLGHVARCLSLAQALSELGAVCRFLTRDLGIDVARQVRLAGFECHALPAPATNHRPPSAGYPHADWAGVDWSVDVQESIAALGDARPGWVIVDHYSFDASWHRAMRRWAGCRMAAIDDLGDRDLDVDLLIDHNHAIDHRAKYGSHLAANAPILAGPRCALIGPSYANARRHTVRAAVRSIGIFMGGADRGGFSQTALRACDAAGFRGEIEVVTTSANPGLAALQIQIANRPGARLSMDLPSLADFYVRHDVQIGASGGSTWERCCVGSPTLAIIVAENQRMVLQPLDGLGVLLAVDEIPVSVDSLARELRTLIDNPGLRESLSARARQLVDGRGAQRVAEYLLQSCSQLTSSAPILSTP